MAVQLKKSYEEGKVSIFENGDLKADVRLSDLSEDIVKRLAVYGLYVKLSRATAGKPEEEKLDAILSTAENLLQGKWASPTARPMSKKDILLNMLKDTDQSIRFQFAQALKTTGQLQKVDLTVEELVEAGLTQEQAQSLLS